jgi:hypothetical protein
MNADQCARLDGLLHDIGLGEGDRVDVVKFVAAAALLSADGHCRATVPMPVAQGLAFHAPHP